MKKTLKGLCSALLLTAASSYAADSAVYLQYHHVSDKTPAVTSIRPDRFKEHLDYLDANGYQVKDIVEVTNAIQSGKSLPDKTIVITFDDAYLNIYQNAFPLLKEKGWPFTVFVSTEPVDRNFGKFLNWDQLREMAKSGATIANHTVSHDHLPEKLDKETDKQWLTRVRKDVEASEARIKDKTGQSVKMLAWPFGETSPEIRNLITEMGYIGFGQQSGAVGPLSDFTRLPRYPMSGNYTSLSGFKTKIKTLPLPVKERLPGTAIITRDNLKPTMEVVLENGDYQKKLLRCYATGQGELEVDWLDEAKTRFSTQAKAPLPVGRSRYNCTAPSNSGRQYYWYSHQWLQFTANGKAID
ncbi:polysaccharide deacetylase [Endozoicomonas sp. OPT23]|uniref:polysaccharide deacetylase family protein n=1 Tax=Endozoicomonas sp. OPT23 TaxID=2072845 RepID=UPI00129C0D5B|nr:polysaccharide deacetylase family protein [Endozoicomonas sp. OPT23]MRI33591.1 polysaccharide deacetylase [Endozoicomonas sp. OPT23]